jgi:hypothetical protein
MNIFQAANGAATFLILGALVPGLARHLEAVSDSPLDYLLANPPIILLGLFIVIFRIKTLLDDHKHFGEAYQDTNAFRYAGFMLAILSWLFWGFAAYLLPSTMRSSELMAVSILISTLWVAVHVIEILVDKTRREQEAVTSLLREKWVVINVLYMLCLVGHVGWFRPVIPPGALAPLIGLLLVLLYDILTSRTLKDLLSAPRAAR